ncbi:MAG: 2,3-bisphosphoglycerate-independent phosphoglycerate mutase [Clostridiales bacterium]|jgi:2,3-bisphosphoglycerate-independent phosphoglycerate mutase|nr:2,3-bisphosphoglycerate-independent phosphoglycerate mutase [Clostridiales bacterium]
MSKKPTVLMILDGFGVSGQTEGNAIKLAKTPNLDKIRECYPYELGYASGLDVGLPEGQMGNSEVGHLNIGAGRVVYQELTRITKSIKDGDFFEKPEFLDAINNCKAFDSAIHFMGLLSDGGVHSHITHLYALLELCKRNGLTKVYVHAFMDGRDTPPTSGIKYINDLENKMAEIGVGKIATVTGRYYAMDRDNRYERVKQAYDALVFGKGNQADSAPSCVESSYAKEVHDEFILPTIIMTNDMPTATIKENDSVVFFNFRPDRAREISRAFCDEDFSGFERERGFFRLKYITFTEYDVNIKNKSVVFKTEPFKNTLGEYISSLGLKQLRLAETEKYAHVTFFLNGGAEKEYPGESRILVPSPKVATYDLMPEMSAPQVTENLVKSILSKEYDLIVINYANPDMVGHTGILDAAICAVEYIDKCIGEILEAVLEAGGQMFICADHGNSDKMVDEVNNVPFTAHTTNPVPFMLVNAENVTKLQKGGKLCDIAPTLLDIMNLPQPAEMTGHSLAIRG